ncbi:Holliday junction resolvase [Aphanothece hegewaldii CCALA 016]|uniref:Holliday junction resolvase n=1 Tax=Aphanothece hegewaldii CCALA 016 TaxID=2107694 RepID=A0A2T1LRT8_9CHRO|nr:crossover junction endodeoxyribonuclease RuvC [Aphanothece hegewaldii]PSF31743.1 Holliday junction resolvase [Aphanothece hegewaldii CCALA 016]
MPNFSPRTDHLPKLISKWLHQPTKALRVPEVFIEQVEAYARLLDQGGSDLSIPVKPPQQPHSSQGEKIWLGIRPSLRQLGWSILKGRENEHPIVVDYGLIETEAKFPLPQRLVEIESDLTELVRQFQPHHVALEKPFINANFASGSSSLQALGVINLVIYRQCQVFPVLLYRATWKSHLGSPKADQREVAETVQLLFDLKRLTSQVGSEAIAIAYAGFCGLGISEK